VVHAGQLLRPGRLALRDLGAALLAPGVAGAVSASRARIASATCLRIADDADRDLLGQPDPVGVDVDLDDLRALRPVVDPVARQGRERVEPGAQAQHHIGLAISSIAAFEPL
jgi:hypothetical protein